MSSSGLEDATDIEVIRSHNSIVSQSPRRLPIHGTGGSSVLHPEETQEVPIVLHGEDIGEQELCLLFVYREVRSMFFFERYALMTCNQTSTEPFNCVRLTRSYNVQKLFNISVSAEPSSLVNSPYMLNLDVSSVGSSMPVALTQLTTLSPQWTCQSLTDAGQ